jgi:hypothetical protein
MVTVLRTRIFALDLRRVATSNSCVLKITPCAFACGANYPSQERAILPAAAACGANYPY